MAHTGIYATSAECIAKLGNNYNSTNVDETMINGFCLQAEALINANCRYIFAADRTAFTALTAGAKYLLTLVASSLVAIWGLNYNPLGEDSAMVRKEYEDRVEVLNDNVMMGLSLLKKKNIQKFITDTATGTV